MKSTSGPLQFGRFTLIPAQRRLLDSGKPVALNARYLDALILLAGDPQAVITKEQLHDEVWHGVAVTDEALTQCIRALRKALGDNAASPTFIETVPKYGYRFIAPVHSPEPAPQNVARPLARSMAQAGAMILGGAGAGSAVGLLYGVADTGGDGASFSLLIVVILIAALAAGISAMGIALGIVSMGGRHGERWRIVLGGAIGGFLTGAIANLLGQDAFHLLFGAAPQTMTGAPEGLALGLACGICSAILDAQGRRTGILSSLVLGGVAGAVVVLTGGVMMGGSLVALVAAFPDSQLTLPIGDTEAYTMRATAYGALEGAIFVVGLTLGAVWYARRAERG